MEMAAKPEWQDAPSHPIRAGVEYGYETIAEGYWKDAKSCNNGKERQLFIARRLSQQLRKIELQ